MKYDISLLSADPLLQSRYRKKILWNHSMTHDSILPLLSNILERVAYTCHMVNNNIIPLYQSGFQRGSSTRTALANLTDNIFHSLDLKKIGILVSLDFSKACDTLNHLLLISKCSHIGFDSSSVNFIKTYLCNHSQVVVVNNQNSSFIYIIYYTSILCYHIKYLNIQSFTSLISSIFVT